MNLKICDGIGSPSHVALKIKTSGFLSTQVIVFVACPRPKFLSSAQPGLSFELKNLSASTNLSFVARIFACSLLRLL